MDSARSLKGTSHQCSALIAAGIFALAGCAVGPVVELSPDESLAYEPFRPAREIRILTLNIWSGLTYEGTFSFGEYPDDREKRYEALVAGIRALSPDIVCLQEVNPLPARAERLAADLDYETIYQVSLGGIRCGPLGIPANLREGQAILVKKPWTLSYLDRARLAGGGIATNWFCFHLGEITQAILARTMVNGKPLYVYCLHLHSGTGDDPRLDEALEKMPEEARAVALAAIEEDVGRRRDEIASLMGFIDATLPRGMPAVLCGDFNASLDGGELDALLASGAWIDTFALKNPGAQGATWDPAGNPVIVRANEEPSGAEKEPEEPLQLLERLREGLSQRIDGVLIRGNVPRERVLESRVVFKPVSADDPGFVASDHYGVLTTLSW